MGSICRGPGQVLRCLGHGATASWCYPPPHPPTHFEALDPSPPVLPPVQLRTRVSAAEGLASHSVQPSELTQISSSMHSLVARVQEKQDEVLGQVDALLQARVLDVVAGLEMELGVVKRQVRFEGRHECVCVWRGGGGSCVYVCVWEG